MPKASAATINTYKRAVLDLLQPGVWLHRLDVATRVRNQFNLHGIDSVRAACEELVAEGLLQRREDARAGISYGNPRPLKVGDPVVYLWGGKSEKAGIVSEIRPHPQIPEQSCVLFTPNDSSAAFLAGSEVLTHLDEIPLPKDLLVVPSIKKTYQTMAQEHGRDAADRYLRTLSLCEQKGMTEHTPPVGEVTQCRRERVRRPKAKKGRSPKQRLLDQIQQNPGITCAGLRSGIPATEFEERYQPALDELERSGEVFRWKYDWSQSIFWYPDGHDVSKLFKPARGYQANPTSQKEEPMTPEEEIQRYRDRNDGSAEADKTTEAGEWQPRTPNERKVLAIIQQMTRPLAKGQICSKAGVADNFLSPASGRKDLIKAYEQKIAELQDQSSSTPPSEPIAEPIEQPKTEQPIPPEPELEIPDEPDLLGIAQAQQEFVVLRQRIAELEELLQQQNNSAQQIADLEERNRQLRSQLSELQNKLSQPAKPQMVEVALPLTYFQQKRQEWLETIEFLEADLASAKANLAAFDRMIELHDCGDDQPQITVASLNGFAHAHH